MDPTTRSTFSTTLLNQELPAIQNDKKDVILNYALTIPEAMFLASVAGMVRANLDQGGNLIYISTSMQNGFREFVAKTFTAKKFSAEDLNLITIIPSLWAKTKTQIENELTVSKNPLAVADEKEWQMTADRTTEEFRLLGRSGQCFTERQARFLLMAVDNIKL